MAVRIILFFIILFLLFGFLANAQRSSLIVTDRPDQSDGAYVLPKNLFQFENGLLFNNEGVINNLMVRYGFSNSSEVRIALDYGKINSVCKKTNLFFRNWV